MLGILPGSLLGLEFNAVMGVILPSKAEAEQSSVVEAKVQPADRTKSCSLELSGSVPTSQSSTGSFLSQTKRCFGYNTLDDTEGD